MNLQLILRVRDRIAVLPPTWKCDIAAWTCIEACLNTSRATARKLLGLEAARAHQLFYPRGHHESPEVPRDEAVRMLEKLVLAN